MTFGYLLEWSKYHYPGGDLGVVGRTSPVGHLGSSTSENQSDRDTCIESKQLDVHHHTQHREIPAQLCYVLYFFWIGMLLPPSRTVPLLN